MALSLITPFRYSQYCTATSEFAQWMAAYVESNPINGTTGWRGHFQSYHLARPLSSSTSSVSKPAWLTGVQTRKGFHGLLVANLTNNASLMKTVNAILAFGGMRPCLPQYAPAICGDLLMLQAGRGNSPWTPGQVNTFNMLMPIASMSKVFEMLDPHEWTIYDSRVGTALAWLVDLYWGSVGGQHNAHLLRFPVPPGRVKKRVRPPWSPSVGGGRQGSLAFIYASWILRQVAEILRSKPVHYGKPLTIQHAISIAPLRPNWEVYHVEMALWMMGKQSFGPGGAPPISGLPPNAPGPVSDE